MTQSAACFSASLWKTKLPWEAQPVPRSLIFRRPTFPATSRVHQAQRRVWFLIYLPLTSQEEPQACLRPGDLAFVLIVDLSNRVLALTIALTIERVLRHTIIQSLPHLLRLRPRLRLRRRLLSLATGSTLGKPIVNGAGHRTYPMMKPHGAVRGDWIV